MKSKYIKMAICLVLLLVIGWGIYASSNTARVKRQLKTVKSEFDNGLDRTITLYDYNGNKIKSWTGKFDVTDSDEEVFFDTEDNKRVIIHGGIVVNEEN